MGLKLNRHIESSSLDLQLDQLAQKVTSNKSRLYIWAEKIIEFRALQMDGLIDEHDDTINSKIDCLEAYIEKSKMILQYLSEQILYAKQTYKTLYEHDSKELHLLLRNYTTIVNTLSRNLL